MIDIILYLILSACLFFRLKRKSWFGLLMVMVWPLVLAGILMDTLLTEINRETGPPED